MPHNELKRLEAAYKFLNIKITREQELREIVRYAAEICDTPDAYISIIDSDTQHVLYSVGAQLDDLRREDVFCNFVIEQDEVLVVPDTALDLRFAASPFRQEPANVQFYAGANLRTQEGYNIGTLCVIDHVAKNLTAVQQKILTVLSRQVVHIFDFELSLAQLNTQYLEAKKAEIKLNSFFESSVSCHLLVGRNLEVLAFNKTFADIIRNTLGVEMEIGNDVNQYIDEKLMPEFLLNFKQALAGKHIIDESATLRNNQKIWWNYDYVPAYDPEGEIIGVSYNAINISAVKVQQEESDAKDASLKAIAFIQSHELRRPVSSILGLMSLFKEDDYRASKEDMMMLEQAVMELDGTIRKTVNHTRRNEK
jgi:hypothetical protein